MHFEIVFFYCLILVISFIVFYKAYHWAPYFKLIHTPHLERHLHKEGTPLVGGVGLFLIFFLVVTLEIMVSGFLTADYMYVIAGALVLFATGFVDDRNHIKPTARLFAQIVAASLLVVGADNAVLSLGFILPGTALFLGDWATLFTIAAVVTAINAFNMIDGIDGLSAGLAAVVLCFVIALNPSFENIFFLVASSLLIALGVFLVFNLGLAGSKRKVFLGDAGSTLLGYFCAWLLIATHNEQSDFLTPIGVVFLLLIPILDVFSVMFVRLYNGMSPFKADQNHIHHLLILFGLTDKKALIIIVTLAILSGLLGLFHLQLGIAEHWLFFLFILLFITQMVIVNRAVRLKNNTNFS